MRPRAILGLLLAVTAILVWPRRRCLLRPGRRPQWAAWTMTHITDPFEGDTFIRGASEVRGLDAIAGTITIDQHRRRNGQRPAHLHGSSFRRE